MDPDVDRFGSRRSTVYGQRGVVATSQPLAADDEVAEDDPSAVEMPMTGRRR
jgi:hypothetical protein